MNAEVGREEAKIRQRAVAETLNLRRISIGMSLRELETLTGIRHSTISDVLRENDIRLWQVFAIAKALDMTISHIFILADSRYYDILCQEAE